MFPVRKVIIIGPAHPLRGGLASYDERLAKEFVSNGFDTTIYTFSLQYPGFLFPGTTQLSSGSPPPGLKIKVSINSVNPFNWLRIGMELKSLKPDLIVVRYWLPFMGPCLGTILRKAKNNNDTKVVCIADNIIPHERRLADRAFTSYFLKPVDGFITMSEKVMEDLRIFTSKKPAKFVCHPLYDNFGEPVSKKEARQKLGFHEDGHIALFFGFIRNYKGLDILLDSIALIANKNLNPRLKDADDNFLSNQTPNNIKFVIAGEFYEDEKPYLEQIKRLNIGKNIILRTTFIPDDEVRYYFCAADCVVQPYRQATQSGVTPLAYYYERPMVVTNVGGLPSLVPDGKVGFVCEPNPQDLADRILRLMELGETYFSAHLKEERKKYSWKYLLDAILKLAGSIE